MGPCRSASTPGNVVPITDSAGSIVKRRALAGFTVKEAVYASGTSLGRHRHSNAYLSLVVSGGYTETYLSGETECAEGMLRFLPAGELHENVFAVPTTCLLIEIEPHLLRRLGDDQVRVLSSPRQIAGPVSSWLAGRMLHEFRADDGLAPLAMEGVLLEILAESAREFGENAVNAPGWLKKVHEFLEASYLRSSGLAELAAVARVHPVHLAREFRRHYRMTVGEFVRKRRIEHASQLLARSALSLSEISKVCGFSDQSHFCALFKRYTGLTPAKFRDFSTR
ncbi:MAG TPA: helix-turn-helix transcriptional regulator [Bryobacteraceae bacterium]|nr:helix-turn-helix transcriptional regulator [Bryobacteraceae bacterium]